MYGHVQCKTNTCSGSARGVAVPYIKQNEDSWAKVWVIFQDHHPITIVRWVMSEGHSFNKVFPSAAALCVVSAIMSQEVFFASSFPIFEQQKESLIYNIYFFTI